MPVLRDGSSTHDVRLDRIVSATDEHVRKYPLTAATTPATPAPMALGINWYSGFDEPVRRDRAWWIGLGDLGRVRGGHCICARPAQLTDAAGWWPFYDQGQEGACVGYGVSRVASLLNRKRYDAEWLYRRAKDVDEFPGSAYEGTTVRAGLEVLRSLGHVPITRRHPYIDGSGIPAAADGIAAYRWARSTDDALAALGQPNRLYVELLNSWGDAYPRVVRLPVDVLERLRREDGEFGCVTDR